MSPMFGRRSNQYWRAWLGLLAIATATACGADQTSPEDVVFTAKCDNSVQKYLVIYPKAFRTDEPHHLLILLHGHGSDRWQGADDSVNEFRAGRDSAAARKM